MDARLNVEDFKGKFVRCKLCGGVHPLKVDKKDRPFTSCIEWSTNYWFIRKPSIKYLLENMMDKPPEGIPPTIEPKREESMVKKGGLSIWKRRVKISD